MKSMSIEQVEAQIKEVKYTYSGSEVECTITLICGWESYGFSSGKDKRESGNEAFNQAFGKLFECFSFLSHVLSMQKEAEKPSPEEKEKATTAEILKSLRERENVVPFKKPE